MSEFLRKTRKYGFRLGLAGTALALAGCESFGGDATEAVTFPEYTLSVDCATDATAHARQDVRLAGVQIMRLTVAGPGYVQHSRVQIFPRNSDVTVAGPQGEAPRYVLAASALRTGEPVAVDLAHGSLTAQQYEVAPNLSAEASPAATTGPALPSQPPQSVQPEQWLSFTLSCEQEGAPVFRQPGQ